MSNDTLEKCIKEKYLKYYEYSEFSKIEEIGGGLVGKVYKTKWKQSEKSLALKSFSLDNVKIFTLDFKKS